MPRKPVGDNESIIYTRRNWTACSFSLPAKKTNQKKPPMSRFILRFSRQGETRETRYAQTVTGFLSPAAAMLGAEQKGRAPTSFSAHLERVSLGHPLCGISLT